MILLAIALIGTGLACLGFVAFSFLQARGPVSTTGVGPPAGTGVRAPVPSGIQGGADAAFAGSPSARAGSVGGVSPVRQPDPANSRPRAATTTTPATAPGEGESRRSRQADPESTSASEPDFGREELSFLRDRLTGLQRIDPDSLNEALRVFEKTERETPEPAPQLVVTGMLYLDHGRKIPGQLGRRGEIPTRVFSELRRIGTGTLILENSSFLIHSGNTSYSYSAGDMDQILFQGSGLALVPIHPDRPIPVFLTREVAAVKAYIKKNARIRSL